jgi:hypothetical protein
VPHSGGDSITVALLFPAITVLSCFLLLLSSANKDAVSVRESAMNACLLIGVIIATLTEALSALNRIDRASVIVAWLLMTVICGVGLFLRRGTLRELSLSRLTDWIQGARNEWLRSSRVIAAALTLTLLAGIFVVSLTLTNNYDSYTYHLPRIEEWIQNRNVFFFPSNFTQQLFRSPFAEYVILHLKLLNDGNGANNLVQYSSYVLSALVVTLIAQQLGASRRQQFYAGVLALTVPMAMLQAETTQTDLVVSFFVLACVYYCLKIERGRTLAGTDLCFLCQSIALGSLTKPTFVLFAFPFCLVMTIGLMRAWPRKLVPAAVVLLAFLAVVDGPFFVRNYRTFGSLVGPVSGAMSDGIVNDLVGPKVLISNMLKDVSLHLSLPYEPWNHLIVRVVSRAHTVLGYSVNDSRSTWYGPYRLMFMVWHDLLGNLMHLMLAAWAGLIAVTRIRDIDARRTRYYLWCLCGFLAFFAILKWQPFNARLDLVGFLLLTPVTVLLLPKKVLLPSLIILLVLGNLIVYRFQEGDKAILSKAFLWSRGAATFAVNYEPSRSTNAKLKAYGVRTIGFAVNRHFPEWSYWLTSDREEFRQVLFPAVLLSVPDFEPTFTYRALIVDKTCLERRGARCLGDDSLNRFLENNQDIADVEEFDNNSELVIFNKDQSRLFLY